MSVNGLPTVHGPARDDHDGVKLVIVRTSTEDGVPTTAYTYLLEKTEPAFRGDLKGTFLLPDAFWVIWAELRYVDSNIRFGAHELLVFGRISGISDR